VTALWASTRFHRHVLTSTPCAAPHLGWPELPDPASWSTIPIFFQNLVAVAARGLITDVAHLLPHPGDGGGVAGAVRQHHRRGPIDLGEDRRKKPERKTAQICTGNGEQTLGASNPSAGNLSLAGSGRNSQSQKSDLGLRRCCRYALAPLHPAALVPEPISRSVAAMRRSISSTLGKRLHASWIPSGILPSFLLRATAAAQVRDGPPERGHTDNTPGLHFTYSKRGYRCIPDS
jgi:hypothetical protein